MFTLTFVEPSGRREVVPLADEERGIVVGRDAGCDVVLQSKEVSRRHARFFVQGGVLQVEDLGAHNGVYIDGNKAEGPTPIVGTPPVELGDVSCAISGTPAAARAARAKAAAPAAPIAAEPIAAPAGSARAGAMAARARAASLEQAKGAKGARPAFTPRAAPRPEVGPEDEVAGIGAGAALRSLAKGGSQIVLPAKATVGRGADCDLVLDDDSVSRHHAELYRDDRGLYRLRDLGSANGSFIDGRPAEPGERIPEGAKLRFGDVELLFWKPPPGDPAQARQRALLVVLAIIVVGFAALYWLKQRKAAERAAAEAAEVVSPQDEARALIEQARASIESDRFEEAARYAQSALDKDPLATEPRKIIAGSRRELDASKSFADANAKAAVGNEDEALLLYAKIDPASRFFARARIKAKDLAQNIVRKHGRACSSAAGREHWDEAADECRFALDVKCQLQEVESDPWLKALRRAEKSLSRRVAWSCPPALAPLFHDASSGPTGGLDSPDGARAMRTLYPDDKLRDAITAYAQGESERALRTLAEPLVMRGKTARLAAGLSEKIRLVDGRFRAGQTALLRNDLTKVDELWGEALQADALLIPAGVESQPGAQMRSALAQAHAKAGDDKLASGQYAGAYDEWTRGLAVAPKDAHMLDAQAQLEKIAEGLLSGNPSCDQIQVAAHVTRAEPPSPAHQAALKASARCK